VFIGIRADDVLGNRHAVFGQALRIERLFGVGVPLLFVRGAVTFDCTLVLIRVSRFGRAGGTVILTPCPERAAGMAASRTGLYN
jgi:hypothetical protein